MKAAVNRIEHETLNERVYHELRSAIMCGRFPPGTVVTLRSLSGALGTSEMPVRDAVRRLVVERALTNLPNRSVIVPVLDEASFREICEIRIQLETLATSHAVERISRRDISVLEKLVRELSSASDSSAYLQLNQKFHFTIYELADRPILLSMIEAVWLQTGPLLNTVELKAGESKASRHHGDAINALARKDGAAAAEAIAADIRDAADFIVAWMRGSRKGFDDR